MEANKAIKIKVAEITLEGWCVGYKGAGRNMKLKCFWPEMRFTKWYPIRKVTVVPGANGEPIRFQPKPIKKKNFWARIFEWRK